VTHPAGRRVRSADAAVPRGTTLRRRRRSVAWQAHPYACARGGGVARGGGRPVRAGTSDGRRLQPPRGTARLRRSPDRYHRRLGVRERGSAGYRHPDRVVDPVRRAGGRPELLCVGGRRPLRPQHRQRPRREAGPDLPVAVREPLPQPEHVPLQHRPGHVPRRPGSELLPDLRPDPGQPGHRQAEEAGERRTFGAVQRGRGIDAELQQRSVRRRHGGVRLRPEQDVGGSIGRRVLPRPARVRPAVRGEPDRGR
jgi:hypothetical protein